MEERTQGERNLTEILSASHVSAQLLCVTKQLDPRSQN